MQNEDTKECYITVRDSTTTTTRRGRRGKVPSQEGTREPPGWPQDQGLFLQGLPYHTKGQGPQHGRAQVYGHPRHHHTRGRTTTESTRQSTPAGITPWGSTQWKSPPGASRHQPRHGGDDASPASGPRRARGAPVGKPDSPKASLRSITAGSSWWWPVGEPDHPSSSSILSCYHMNTPGPSCQS